MTKKVKWLSLPPVTCDTCTVPIDKVFYDMKTEFGPWGCLCPNCAMFGPGIGKTGRGRGQKFEKQTDGSWLKTEG